MKNQFGQTLIEMVVAIALVTFIVTAITITTVNGLRNSQFSQNQSQATKLAQEGLEGVRQVKERNSTVCNAGTKSNWNALWTTACSNNSCDYQLMTGAGTCNGTTEAIWLNQNATAQSIVVSGVTFTRSIQVRDYSAQDKKKVTATVSWSDISGSHSSVLETILAKY